MGFVFNLLLSGAALYQTASYFDNFRSDHRRYKFAVAIVGIINLTDTICIISGSYYYVITNFGNYLNLLKTDWQRKSPISTIDDCAEHVISRNSLGPTMLQRLYRPVFVRISYVRSSYSARTFDNLRCVSGSYVVSGRKLYVALLIVACATIQLAFGISVTSMFT